jgi:hypothetical protein
MLKMHRSEYGCKLQGLPNAPQFGKTLSSDCHLLTGTNYGIQPPKLPNCLILIRCTSRERWSADIWLKLSPRYYMKLTLTIRSGCTVRVTIVDLLTVKEQILLCLRWVNVLNLTYKTQLASILSITCNIQHLTQPQSPCKRQWSMIGKEVFATSGGQIH